jgi:hypothetical protein
MRPDGSDRTMVLSLDTLKNEAGVAWPTALPNGRGILARVRRLADATSDYSIVALDLRDGSRKELVRGLVAKYSPTGHLLWITGDGALRPAIRPQSPELRRAGVLWNGIAIAVLAPRSRASPRGPALCPGTIRTGFSRVVWVTRDGENPRTRPR